VLLMDFLISKSQQIAVVAENPDEALKKVMNGEGNAISGNYSVQARPQVTTSQTGGGSRSNLTVIKPDASAS
jgi:hypothetical protein